MKTLKREGQGFYEPGKDTYKQAATSYRLLNEQINAVKMMMN
ncbi:hypothetical protein ACT7DH_12265 [Bacillus pacificus]